MKKIAMLVLFAVLVSLCTLGVSAASAFENVMITDKTKLVDDAANNSKGGSGKPIAYMETHGVGYSSLGDQVVFEGVDFGKNGADKVYINFGYGNNDNTKTTLAVYVDKKTDKPAATFEIGYTGGWDKTKMKEFEAKIDVPAGKHDIIVEFTNEKSGSFTYVRFNEAPAKPAAAPATADPVTVTVALAALSLAGIVTAKKTRR
ncbi:MAG: carbohydrate-binding protein [Oscillospiraceae bacterium]|nr:carbohydrate-binding protein [Oscillospiraceae bacterium]